ncbi:MAG: hypothetical protein C0594_00275 [Marinilabiliales bacterium]|nr:MAG: hypothetical protein C0594_00275 [Marinilabiliales bacterium]
MEKKLILIAEDNFPSKILLMEILSDYMVNILWADDGLKAYRMVEDNPNIELVIMDVEMPVMDGLESAQLIKKLRPELMIIAHTAYSLSEQKLKYFDDCIRKPSDPKDLLGIVKMSLGIGS